MTPRAERNVTSRCLEGPVSEERRKEERPTEVRGGCATKIRTRTYLSVSADRKETNKRKRPLQKRKRVLKESDREEKDSRKREN